MVTKKIGLKFGCFDCKTFFVLWFKRGDEVENHQTFERLPLADKIKTLYVEGTFITSIRYYEYKINLYLFRGNYLEVFYHHKRDQIEKIEPLQQSNTRMKFYLDQVKLSELPI